MCRAYLAQLCMLVRHGQSKQADKDKILVELYRYRRILHLNWTMKVPSRKKAKY